MKYLKGKLEPFFKVLITRFEKVQAIFTELLFCYATHQRAAALRGTTDSFINLDTRTSLIWSHISENIWFLDSV